MVSVVRRIRNSNRIRISRQEANEDLALKYRMPMVFDHTDDKYSSDEDSVIRSMNVRVVNVMRATLLRPSRLLTTNPYQVSPVVSCDAGHHH